MMVMTPLIVYEGLIASFTLDTETVPFYMRSFSVAVHLMFFIVFDNYLLYKILKRLHKLFVKKEV